MWNTGSGGGGADGECGADGEGGANGEGGADGEGGEFGDGDEEEAPMDGQWHPPTVRCPPEPTRIVPDGSTTTSPGVGVVLVEVASDSLRLRGAASRMESACA